VPRRPTIINKEKSSIITESLGEKKQGRGKRRPELADLGIKLVELIVAPIDFPFLSSFSHGYQIGLIFFAMVQARRLIVSSLSA